jgi:hypothetical protein
VMMAELRMIRCAEHPASPAVGGTI